MPNTSLFFFFNDTATTEIYTLSLHDALPISAERRLSRPHDRRSQPGDENVDRSEEHTSELQSQSNLVCRLLLEKKKMTGLEGIAEQIMSSQPQHPLQRRNLNGHFAGSPPRHV